MLNGKWKRAVTVVTKGIAVVSHTSLWTGEIYALLITSAGCQRWAVYDKFISTKLLAAPFTAVHLADYFTQVRGRVWSESQLWNTSSSSEEKDRIDSATFHARAATEYMQDRRSNGNPDFCRGSEFRKTSLKWNAFVTNNLSVADTDGNWALLKTALSYWAYETQPSLADISCGVANIYPYYLLISVIVETAGLGGGRRSAQSWNWASRTQLSPVSVTCDVTAGACPHVARDWRVLRSVH